MRKWHRWLALPFAVVLLWIAATGVLSQIVPIIQNGGFEEAERAAPALPAGFVCPETMTCRPKPPGGGRSLVGLLHHLHSGESLGPVGTIIATLGGVALLFFAGSGLWLYLQMFARRRRAGRRELFWD